VTPALVRQLQVPVAGDRDQAVALHARHRLADRRAALVEALGDPRAQRWNALLLQFEDGAEILAKKPGTAPVSAMAWSADGAKLAFGTEDGEAGIADLA